MSRAYRIRVSQSTARTVHLEDGIQTQLELLQILLPEEMAELLAAELEALGFEREDEIARKVTGDGVAVEVDLVAGTVTARSQSEVDVNAEVRLSRTVDRRRAGEARAELASEAERALEAEVNRQTKKHTAELTGRLEAALRDLRAELDRATNRATARALEIRARQLGEVQEISENPETGELTIRVKV